MAVLSDSGRRCPRDGALLKPVLFNRGTLHFCEQCHGSFAPGSIVMDVPRIKRWFAMQPDGAASLPDGDLPCPEGHGAMHELRLDKTHQLDLCATCRGIWFDVNELKNVDQHSGQVSRGEPNARVNNSSLLQDSAETVVDDSGLLDGAFELLGDIVSGIDISF
jgi:Zn-finger nucleic acid-binding protein